MSTLAISLAGCAGAEMPELDTDAPDPSAETTATTTGAPPPVLAFEGAVPLLPGLDLDSGWQPEEGPAGVRFSVAAFGDAQSSGRANAVDGTLQGLPGSGALELSGGFTIALDARLSALGFDEEVEVSSFEFLIPEVNEAFDPFVTGESHTASTNVPATELGTFVVPSIPGASVTVELTGGTVEATFHTTCAATDSDYAQAAGVITMEGTLELSATLEVEVPLADPQTFGPFAVALQLPAVATDVDLGTRSLSDGGSAGDAGLCSPSATTTDATSASGSGATDSDASDTDSGSDTSDESSTGDPTTDTDDTDATDTTTGPLDPCTAVICGVEEVCEDGVCVPTDDTSEPPQCEPGTCDVCDDYGTCVDCAESPGGECSDARDACQGNPACVAIENCVAMCSDPTCPQQCETSNPGGAADYDAIRMCRVDTCQD